MNFTMAKKTDKKFTDVLFPRAFPAQLLAEHEVFMSFTDDIDAERFDEWWQLEGSVQFQKYINENPQ